MKKEFTSTQKITISAICIALYLVVMLCTQGFAFGQYQVRIATALYGLSYNFPFLVLPFGIANVTSNILSLGPLDAICGFFMGIAVSGAIVLGRKAGFGSWIVAAAVTLLPGLGVPLWLSPLLGIPYGILVTGLLIGQLIAGIAGMLLINALERADVLNFAFNTAKERE